MVSQGAKPAVISGLMKYQATERMRKSLNHALDIHGGKGICDGPHNYLQAAYQISPVSITVEGANILSRSLIVFAQGAIRSHPYLYSEIKAAQNPDKNAGFEAFEKAFEGHFGFSVSNVYRAFFHNVTGGMFAKAPVNAPVPYYYAQLERASTNFARCRRHVRRAPWRRPESEAAHHGPHGGRSQRALLHLLPVEAL